MMRAAIYARRSTDEHQAASLDVQVSEARRFIQSKGWSLDEAHIFIDDGISRAEFKRRPGLFKMLNAAEDGLFDVLVVRDESRLGGDMNRTSLLISDLIDNGVKVFYYINDEEVRADDVTSKFLMIARNFAAELEREKIASRTREHLMTKARRGLNVGGRVYGYRNVEIKEGDQRVRVEYEIDPEEAEIVREIFEMYASGDGIKKIAGKLNERKIPSPRNGSWCPSAIREMLRRERYRGVLVWGKKTKVYKRGTKVRIDVDESQHVVVDAPHLRIVSDELWNAAQLRSHAWPASSPKGGRPPRYLLSTLARCSQCGGPITVSNGKSGKDIIKVYGCSYHRNRGNAVCSVTIRRPVDSIDAVVLDYLSTSILGGDRFGRIFEALEEILHQKIQNASTEVREWEEEVSKIKREIDRLVVAITTTDDPPTALVQAMAERQSRMDDLNAKIRATKAAPSAIQDALQQLKDDARKKLADLANQARKEPDAVRAAIKDLLVDDLVFEPVEGQKRFRIRGKISPLRLVRNFPNSSNPVGVASLLA